MFVVDSGSAKQTQDDVNRLMEAVAQLLDKLVSKTAPPPESKPPVIAVDQEWEYREPDQTDPRPGLESLRLPQLETFNPSQLTGESSFLQIQGQERLPQLEDFNPQMLEGQTTQPQLVGNANAPLLEEQTVLPGAAKVSQPGQTGELQSHTLQIQFGEVQISGTVPEIQAKLQQLPLEQIAALNEAIQQPVGTTGTQQAISIVVDGALVLDRNEQGEMLVNAIQPIIPTVQTASAVATPDAKNQTDWTTVEAEVTGVERIAAPAPPSHLEVRPVGEAEVMAGEQMGESSSIHDLVLQQAPSVVVTVDDEGKVKPNSAMRDQVEATEDEVETEVQTEQQQEQHLTAEAMAVVDQLKDYFQQTGDRFFIGQEYVFENQPDGIRLLAHDPKQPPISIVGNQVDPPIDPRQYEQLMQRFSSSYERIQVAQGQEGYEQDYELGR